MLVQSTSVNINQPQANLHENFLTIATSCSPIPPTFHWAQRTTWSHGTHPCGAIRHKKHKKLATFDKSCCLLEKDINRNIML